MAALGELVVSLSANTAKFTEGLNKAEFLTQKSFDKMKKSAKELGAVLGTASVAGVTAFAYSVNEAVKVLADLDDMAQKTGSSVESLSRLQKVAVQFGQDFSSVDSAIVKLSKNLANIDDATDPATRALKSLGISQQFVKENDPSKVFIEIAKKLQGFKDGADKVALGNDLMGKGFAELLPYLNDTAENIDKFTGVSAESAKNAADFQDKIGGLKVKFDELVQTVTIGMLPTLDLFLTKLNQVLQFQSIFSSVGGIDSKDYDKEIAKRQAALKEVQKSKENLSKPTLSNKINDVVFGDVRDLTVQIRIYEDEIKALNDLKIARDMLAKTTVKQPEVKKDLNYQSASELAESKKNSEAAEKVLKDARKKANDEKLKDLQAEINFELEIFEMKNKQEVELAKKTQKEILDAKERYIEIEQKRANENFANAQKLAQDTKNEWQEAFEELKNSIDGYSRDMSRSLAQFALGGKMSFADMIDNMLLKLLEFANQKLIFDPLFKSISGVLDAGSAGGSNGGGIGGFLAGVAGSVFGGGSYGSSFDSSGAYNGGYFQDGMPIDGFRANGGSVSAGRNYIVGERGAEMFVPSSNGSIVPNNQMGGGNTVLVNVIEAEGTKANVQQQQNPDGSMSISVIVEQLYGVMNRDLQRGSGIAPTLERRYGLNRLAGA